MEKMSWKDKINTVNQQDCLELMKEMPDNCVDLVLTDPPYGIGEAAGKNKSRGKLAIAKDYGNDGWDNKIPERRVFEEMIRVSKNQIIFGGNFFVEYLTNSSCWIVWDKDNGKSDFADCELAWTSFGSAVRYFKYRWAGMLQENMKNKDYRVHPTQKPVSLMRQILQKYTKEKSLVFDPFMGSWTTARACKDLGHNFIGAEVSEKYCEAGRERLRQEILL